MKTIQTTESTLKKQNEIKKMLIDKGAKSMSDSLFSSYLLYRGRKIRISDHKSLSHNVDKFGAASVEVYANKVKNAENAIKNINKKLDAYERFEKWETILFSEYISDTFEKILVKDHSGSLIKYLSKSSESAIKKMMERYV